MPVYTVYIFDVDGTLTPSRDVIDPEFEEFFIDWAIPRNVHLITGSDYSKTQEQVGSQITEGVMAVHNCAGNSIWSRGHEIYRSDWTLPSNVKQWLRHKLQQSSFSLRTGQHIEERDGLVNFSIVGRGATKLERQIYVKYDTFHQEREKLTQEFNQKFSGMEAAIGGETGIDIYKQGCNKAQILARLEGVEEIFFFGDAIYEGGNDWALAQAIKNRQSSQDAVYSVSSWEETYAILKQT